MRLACRTTVDVLEFCLTGVVVVVGLTGVAVAVVGLTGVAVGREGVAATGATGADGLVGEARISRSLASFSGRLLGGRPRRRRAERCLPVPSVSNVIDCWRPRVLPQPWQVLLEVGLELLWHAVQVHVGPAGKRAVPHISQLT
jgi:hypothetical protein